MKSLFTTAAQVAQYIGVDFSGDIAVIQPYAAEANKFLRRVLGEAQFATLLSYANPTEEAPETDEVQEALLEFARMPAANFAYMLGANKLIVKVGGTGISVVSTTNTEPVSVEKLELFRKACAASAYNGLEDLILFVKDNPLDYPDAHAHIFESGLFLNSAEEVNTLIHTDLMYRDFFDAKPQIFLFETELVEMFGAERIADMKAAEPTEENLVLLNTYIKPALAMLIFGYAAKSDKHSLAGKKLLENMRNHLATLAETTVPRYNNEDQDNPGLFVFGG